MSENSTVTSLRESIKQAKDQIAELEFQLEAALAETPEFPLARELHELTCRWNHTDGCSWYYEVKNRVDDWSGFAHGLYLGRARLLLAQCQRDNITVDQAIKYFQLVQGS